MTLSTEPQLTDVLKDAQAWVRKLHSGRVTRWEASAFQRWVEADPARLAAVRQASRQWQLMGAAGARLLQADPAVARHHREALMRRARPDRRAFLGFAVGGAGAAAVVAYAPLDLWPALRLWGADERTAAGEQRQIEFVEHVQVALNTRTSVRRLAADERSIGGMELIEGEAAVDVARAAKPFRVVAGAGRVVANAASFEIRMIDDQACVTCVSGTVVVDHPAGQRTLRESQLLRYNRRAISDVAAARPNETSAWRRGELVFQQTPLPLVIDEINRYRAGKVVLVGDAVRRKTVSARIKIAELDTALLQIQHSFQLDATHLPSHVLLLSS
ncbi:FecR family protein [Roseateles chitosanitabidus]|uniref:FecR family protein n=1 Tax=Roseateles chitosanitabidus TaxID=65048 RepID=UPI00082D3F25|nr:FecR domain-containing protein [Roseateles chitosanitabidus]